MPAYRMPKYQGPGKSLIEAYKGWQAQEPSVMDAAWEAPAKKLGKFAEFFMPSETDVATTNFAPGLGSVGVPLITIFKNKAQRMANTGEFKKLAELFYNRYVKENPVLAENVRSAANQFAEKYPRVAAHTDLSPVLAKATSYARTHTPSGKVTKQIPVEFAEGARETVGTPGRMGQSEARSAMFHEGTHVAQSLGNKDARELYDLANKLGGVDWKKMQADPAVSYLNNPFEQRAFQAGYKAAGYSNPEPKALYTKLNEIANAPTRTMEHEGYRSRLIEILKQRGQYNEKVPGQKIDLGAIREGMDPYITDAADVKHIRENRIGIKPWR